MPDKPGRNSSRVAWSVPVRLCKIPTGLEVTSADNSRLSLLLFLQSNDELTSEFGDYLRAIAGLLPIQMRITKVTFTQAG